MKRNGELPALVTNNVRNIINAGKLTGLHLHVGCLAHVINLATQRGLKVARMGVEVDALRIFFPQQLYCLGCSKKEESSPGTSPLVGIQAMTC